MVKFLIKQVDPNVTVVKLLVDVYIIAKFTLTTLFLRFRYE